MAGSNTFHRREILLINPNSSKSMTDGLAELMKGMPLLSHITLYTAPLSSPPSINNETDAALSTDVVYQDLFGNDKHTYANNKYDGYIVACYSHHPLVEKIRNNVPPFAVTAGDERLNRIVHVTGIFESSISTALSLLPQDSQKSHKKFGIVSTGTYWKETLEKSVAQYLGTLSETSQKFKGVETTGLNADQLHSADPEVVKQKMKEATKRLVADGDVNVVILGCAGMAGLDGIIREALEEAQGSFATRVHVLDGVKAGIGMIENLIRVS